MSMESARAFVERIKNDAEFVEELRKCKDLQEKKELIESEGYDFTADEIEKVKNELICNAELIDDVDVHITGNQKEKNKKGSLFNLDLSVPFTNFNLKINI